MHIARTLGEIPAAVPSVVTLGTFDGLHLGHRAIIRALGAVAREEGLRSVLITFDPHPREVLGVNGQSLFLLTTIEERLALIAEEGLDLCVVIPFTRELSLRSAEEFFAEVIARAAGARHVVVGFDHKFGKGRGADAEDLRRIAAAAGIRSTLVPARTIAGAKISSTEIRRALDRGDAAAAALMLGRPYRFSGIVQRGEGLGMRIGVPTANLHLDSARKLIPARGVFAVEARMGAERLRGVMNIGTRPTFSAAQTQSVEVHLLDFAGDLYGVALTIDLLARLRDEKRFPSADALVEQIRRDERDARRFFAQQENETQQLQ